MGVCVVSPQPGIRSCRTATRRPNAISFCTVGRDFCHSICVKSDPCRKSITLKMTKQKDFANSKAAAIFDAYPKDVKTKLLFLRQLIFNVASQTAGVGELEETLKWGQPSYLTTASKSGSLIRIDQIKSQPGKYAMYFHCQTTLVDKFKEMYRSKFEFVGNRSIIFSAADNVPVEELRHCISMALTYHLNKKAKSSYLKSHNRAAS